MSAPLPHGFVPEVEQQLLGALLEGGNHTALLSSLEERQFVNALHAGIYGAIRTAHDRYSSTALPVVAKVADDELHRLCKQLTGGDLNPYLAALSADTVYSAGTAAKAAQNVVKQHARVLLAQEAGRIAAAAADPAADPQELVRATGTTFDDIVTDLRQGARRRSRVHAAEASAAAMQAAREAQERQGLTGITSGLVDIDRQTGGLQCRDLTLIAARPSMGKTTLGTSIAVRAARAGHGVGFVSLEMDAEKLATRCISDIAHEAGIWVPYSDVIKGSATRQQLDSLADASAEFGRLPVWIEDQTSLSIAAIRTKVEAMIAAAEAAGVKLELLIVDHLGLVAPSSRYSGNKVNEVGEITAGLKVLAREFGIAVVLLCQLNRQVESRENKRPVLADLRDSGAIEQDADVVMFVYREAYYLEREKPDDYSRAMARDQELAAVRTRSEIIIAKQRNGAICSVPVFMDMPYSAVRNAARESLK